MSTLDRVANAAESHLTLPLTRQERFEVFHAKHPEVYALLVRLTRDVKRRGYSRYSMKAI